MADDTKEQLTQDGQEVQQGTFNNVAKQAADADDRVWAELLRLAPYDGTHYARAVIPFGPTWGPTYASNALIQPVNGGVKIMPFRAIVGSRAAISAYTPPAGSPALVTGQNNPNAVTNLRGIKSALYVPTDDNATFGHFQSLANNSSGNPRIDLVYATITVNANGGSVSRMVRPPTVNSAPAVENLVLQIVQPITIGVVTGATTSGPPVPTLPADTPGSGIFNIPLAYVMVPGTFNSGISTLGQIQIVAPCVPFEGRATGALRVRPATAIAGDPSASPSFPTAALQAWAGGTPPPWPLPSTMVGGESLTFVQTWFAAGSSSPDGSVVDDSIDWRGRNFLWFAQSSVQLAWGPGVLNQSTATGASIVPASFPGSGAYTSTVALGMGQSYGVDDTAASAGMGLGSTRHGSVACCLTNAQGMPSGQVFALYVDQTTGKLMAYNTVTFAGWSSVNHVLYIWLFATAQIDNGLF